MNFKTVEISKPLRRNLCHRRKFQARPGYSQSYLCMRPCSLIVICIKYIGSRSTQVMISESRAVLHLCTCGNRATTDDDGDVATTAAAATNAAAAVAMATAASSERSEYYMSPRRAATAPRQCRRSSPPPRICSAV